MKILIIRDRINSNYKKLKIVTKIVTKKKQK